VTARSPWSPSILVARSAEAAPDETQGSSSVVCCQFLRTGAPWHDLPDCYPPYHICHRRFQRWVEEGVFSGFIEILAWHLQERVAMDL
jgi:transposase